MDTRTPHTLRDHTRTHTDPKVLNILHHGKQKKRKGDCLSEQSIYSIRPEAQMGGETRARARKDCDRGIKKMGAFDTGEEERGMARKDSGDGKVRESKNPH